MTPFIIGDRVEVVDPSHRFYHRVGTVEFLVCDNIYVRFPHARWLSTKVLFAEQLRHALAAPAARKHAERTELTIEPAR